ncbi:MAG: family glycosyltransferase, 4-amino-4-deoxy-L-arabinose transferase [Candidatus Levybacteria bacterium]|nr:family glycosyltransferase, 4-amino-4-deoxy-L-arabinose transferase [Candidatus Levybacteria bacterium]
MKKIEIFFLALILVGAFAARLYHFSWPVADWHSWRQTDTSAVSRNFVQNGFDFLHPKFEDLSSGVSLIDNPQGYRFVEFPFYNILQAGLFKTFHIFTIEEWGRLVTIFFSLVSIVFLYLLVQKYTSVRVGLFAAFFYAFIPYNIYYGRTILPDSLMLASFLASVYFFSQYLDKQKVSKFLYYLLGIICLDIAFLIKPYVAFYALPFAYLIYSRYGIKGFVRLDMWLFFLLSILPFGLWRVWMNQYPAGIPRNDWLWNGTKIRFRPAFFQWIFAERISKLILGYWGLIFVIFGLIIKPFKKEGWFFFTFIISSLLYLFTFATGNVQHDYYQMLIIPTLAIFFGKGLDGLLNIENKFINQKIARTISVIGIVFMLIFGWFLIRDYYNIQHPNIILAGQAVNRLTLRDAKIIAPYGGDSTFLYFTNRNGWPVFDRSYRAFKKAGAAYLVFADPSWEDLNNEKLFKPVIIAPTYAIFDMTKPTAQGLIEQAKD